MHKKQKYFGEMFWAKKWNIMQRDCENLVQTKVQISQEKPKKVLKKVPNWKAHELDGVQGILLKNFTSLHLNACLEGKKPQWMTKGRTVLTQKDKSKRNEARNYHPITCLPLTWKLFTGIITDEIYGFLANEWILPED